LKLSEQYGLDLPIVRAVAAVLKGEDTPRSAVEKLMALPLRPED